MTRRTADGSPVIRRRFALPPMWQWGIIMILLVLYSAVLISITATAVEQRLEPSSAPTREEWHPPLKWPDPDDSWLYRPDRA